MVRGPVVSSAPGPLHGQRSRCPRDEDPGYRPAVDATDLLISDQPEVHRFEALRAGVLVGFVDYRWAGHRRVLVHTEVPTALGGQGIGSALARHVLDLAREHDERISIRCPYLRTFIERHPEYRPDDHGRIPRRDTAG